MYIRQGGLMRCCLETARKHISEHRCEVGETLHCEFEPPTDTAQMRVERLGKDLVWGWTGTA